MKKISEIQKVGGGNISGKIYKNCGNTTNMANHIKGAHPLLEKDIPKCTMSMNSFLISSKIYEKSPEQRKKKLMKHLFK